MAGNQRAYEAGKQTLKKGYNSRGNSHPISIEIPKEIYKYWQAKRERGLKRSLADVVGVALNFALLGPHPFEDPVEGLEEAFRVYEQREAKEREIAVTMVRKIAAMYGLEVIIKGQDDV